MKSHFRYVRFIILIVSVFFLAFVQASTWVFNTAYVEMSKTVSSPLYGEYLELIGNRSDFIEGSERDNFDWSPSNLSLSQRRYTFTAMQKSMAFACTFAGSLFGTFPMLYLLKRIGARMTMFIIGAVCSLLCALTPHALATSFPLFVALRFVSGFVSAPILPLIGAIIEEWGTMEEKGLFISCLTTNDEIATLFSLPVGALMAEHISWPATFYIHGMICAFFTIVLFFVYRDDPASHFLMSTDEATAIKKGKNNEVDKSPSFRSALSSPAVWAIFVSAMGFCIVAPFMGTFSPQYFTSVLGYSTTFAGTITIIPTIALLPVKFITGLVSDRLSTLSEVAKMRLFNSLASVGAAVVFVAVICVQPGTHDVAATVLILIPYVLFGFVVGGLHKSLVMISREHAPFVYGIMHTFDMFSFLAATFFIPLLTPDNTFEQWKIIFGIFITVLIATNVVFTILVKAEPEEWAQPRHTMKEQISTLCKSRV